MFFQNKATRFKLKVWCLCGEDGYSYYFSKYTGKQENSLGLLDSHFGKKIWCRKQDVVTGHCDLLKHVILSFFSN